MTDYSKAKYSGKATDPKFLGSEGIVMPQGTTAERPGSPELGTLRYNTQLGFMEQYNATGWAGIDAPPTVTNLTGTISADTDSTITISGSNFKSGSTVTVTGPGVNNLDRVLATTFVNSSTLTAATNASAVNYVGGASFNIKVSNPSGLSAVLEPAGTIDRSPTWNTGAGSLGTFTTTASATGGDISYYTDGGQTYQVHTFYDSGNLVLGENVTADVLLVGGGGAGHGGFQSPGGGGGGAGGLVYYSATSLTAGTKSITVGAGGYRGFSDTNDGGNYRAPTAGGNTSFTGLTTAVGGGRGGGYSSTPSTTGGSGGGGNWWGDGSQGFSRPGTANQGNSGGQGSTDTNGQNSGGGGGAGGAGVTGQGNGGIGGAGGAGVTEGSSSVYNFTTGGTATFNINGSGAVYAAGGGGGTGFNNNSSQGSVEGGSTGVGGRAGRNTTAGCEGRDAITAHTGSGGGGAGGIINTNLAVEGGDGAKGVCIVRIPVDSNSVFKQLSATDPDGDTVTYSLASGSLPAGITLDTSTGALKGIPTIPSTAQTYNFTINAVTTATTVPRSFSCVIDPIPADTGAGRGYSIAQGADGSNANGITNTSQTKYLANYNQAGVSVDPWNYTNSGFGYHTGHQDPWWPCYSAIQVSSATYGRVCNQFQWYKHTNSCGNIDFYGSNRSITSGNYQDLSLWTHLGRGHAGGPGSGNEDGVMTFNFNGNNYGYRWYMIVIWDADSTALAWPRVGNNRQGWANDGGRLNKV